MEYSATITVFNFNLQPTQTTVEGSKSQIENAIDSAITNAGTTFHNIQVIIMPVED